MRKGVIAVFDFDGTLIRNDSFIEFAKYSVGRKRLINAILRNLFPLVAWKLRLLDGGEAKQRLFSSLFKGIPLETFRQYCKGFSKRLNEMERESVMDKLHYHLECGHEIYLISASIYNWLLPWGLVHGFKPDQILSTEIEVDNNGLLTGKFLGRNCNGEEKLRRFKEKVPEWENYEIYVYGDSRGDEALMSIAAHKEWV